MGLRKCSRDMEEVELPQNDDLLDTRYKGEECQVIVRFTAWSPGWVVISLIKYAGH